jgi:hypothetical protein
MEREGEGGMEFFEFFKSVNSKIFYPHPKYLGFSVVFSERSILYTNIHVLEDHLFL